MWNPLGNPLAIGGNGEDAHDVVLNKAGDKNKIQVYARFRPKSKKDAEKSDKSNDDDDDDDDNKNEEVENDEVEVTLPLHQRLAMIRMSHRLKSNRQALKVLTSEGGWFQSRWTDIANRANAAGPADSSELSTKSMSASESISGKSIKGVAFIADEEYIREDEDENANNACNGNGNGSSTAGKSIRAENESCSGRDGQKRPPTILPKTFSVKSGKSADRIVASVQNVDPGTARVVMIAPDVGLREFSFDGVFPDRSPQGKVYEAVAKRLVMDFINGYNASAIVYGQTGAVNTTTTTPFPLSIYWDYNCLQSHYCVLTKYHCEQVRARRTLCSVRTKRPSPRRAPPPRVWGSSLVPAKRCSPP
jgi:Kinesin motor domain